MQTTMLLQLAVQFAYLIFIIALIVYAVVHRHRCPKPAGLLSWAFALMLLSHVGALYLRVLLGRALSATQFAMALQLVSAAQMCLSMVAFVLIVKAVFAERRSGAFPADGLGDAGRPLADQPSDNPYASPRQ
jgi:hypothetical protein